MSSIKGSFISAVASKIPIKTLLRCSKETLIFPFYHTVSDDYLPHIHPLYKPKTVDAFKQDLEFLLNHFQPVSMEEVYDHLQKKTRISRPSFHLSFDDGLKEIHEVVFPILTQRGIPFTVFVNSAYVDNRDLFFRYKAALLIDYRKDLSPTERQQILSIGYQQKEQLDLLAEKQGFSFPDSLEKRHPYLTTEALSEMKSQGVTIGAHSIDHPLYSSISEDEQVRQTLESVAFVKKQWNESKAVFAFPFTDEKIASSFFDRIYPSVDLTFGISGISFQQKNRHLGRINMEKYGKNANECIRKAYLVSLIKNK